MIHNHIESERGIATLIALILVGMLTLIGLAALSTSEDEVTIAGNEMQEMKAFYAAESGLERAAAALQAEYEETGAPPVNMPVGEFDVNDCEVYYKTGDDGAATQRDLTLGTLAGLHALVKSFSITAVSSNSAHNTSIQMEQSFETALVPIFQFAVFYGNDLEIAPGPDMSLIGRVHSNGNLYLQANSSLTMDSYVTASGNIIHGRKGPGGVGSGDILIKDASGNYVSMQQGGGFLDATDGDWFDSSLARWNGRVQDSAHGQGALEMPLTNSDDPHKIIEPSAGNPDSFENKASLKCINGVWSQKIGGVWQDVTASLSTAGIISTLPNQFYDGRELVDVDLCELDMDALYSSSYAPTNGVIYYSQEPNSTSAKDFPALRLVDGDELGDALTIASENPVYTLGDYNSVNKKPAAIMADAVSFLSDAWDDTKGAMSKSDRIANETVVNCSYMTGNIETTSSDYNGGFENLPRFLEKWSNKKFTWSGSAVNLWNSVQADGIWNGTYYSPPIRDWAYDTDLDDPNKLPPESPVVRVFQRTGWKQSDVGYTQVYSDDLN